MTKKKYTVLIFSQETSRVKRFIFSPLTLKIGAAVLAFLLIVSAYLFYDYISYQKKIFDLRELRSELNSRQAEIKSFLEKINLLEEQLTRLKLVEEQVKKDLKEVQELKKEKKGKKLTPPPAVPHKTSEKDHFADLTYPRRREVMYPLINVITIAICAVICGADDFVAIAKFGRTKRRLVRAVPRSQCRHPIARSL